MQGTQPWPQQSSSSGRRGRVGGGSTEGAGAPSVALDRWVSVKPSSGLAETIDELVGVTTDRLVEHLDVVRIGRVAQHVALAVEHETGRLYLLLHDGRVDAMQRVGITHAGTRLRHMVHHHEQATGLERVEYLLVERHRIDAAHELVRVVVVVLR